jgi:ABC-type ATPase with predicted acetyltransferase domain
MKALFAFVLCVQLINKHNKTVMKGKATFEPARHSVKEYKMWEKASGKKYRELSVDERADANKEIDAMLRDNAAAANAADANS